ncbi:hypothetical protein [Amycolatopsis sp. NPDC058986]|uniref:hypothetical protein n=1 Tax=unclassified Amycolatopsis TaxID=2618356 RepID=UPI00366DDF45
MSRLRDLLAQQGTSELGAQENSLSPSIGTAEEGGVAACGRTVRDAVDLHVARAELVLARPPRFALKALPVRPDDPLQSLANALGDVRPDLGEKVDVCLDLIPLTPAKIRHLARQAAQHAGGDSGVLRAVGSGVAEAAGEVLGEFLPNARGAGRGAPRPTARGAASSARAAVNKFATDEPVFAVQVLIRCQSEIPGRAQAHLRSVIGAFDVYRGENYWRARGPRILGWHVGADTPIIRRLFDRRFRTGLAKARS